MGILSAFVEKFARHPEDIRAENLRHWVSTLPGITPLSEITTRQRYKVAGVIQNIRIDPRVGRDSMEATITDGSGTLIAKWLGRPTMSGIRLGAGLIVEGVIGRQDGDLVLLNPEYDLVPGPEHG